MKLQVQIEDGIIVDTKFKTFGCGSGERREKRSGEERRGAGTYGVPCSVYVRAVYVHAVFVRKENTRRLIGNLTFLVHLYPIPFPRSPRFPYLLLLSVPLLSPTFCSLLPTLSISFPSDRVELPRVRVDPRQDHRRGARD